ncbi:hypothetical protein F5X96DRAFT_613791, partial [Biscogniauxia mediterranea]
MHSPPLRVTVWYASFHPFFFFCLAHCLCGSFCPHTHIVIPSPARLYVLPPYQVASYGRTEPHRYRFFISPGRPRPRCVRVCWGVTKKKRRRSILSIEVRKEELIDDDHWMYAGASLSLPPFDEGVYVP